MGENRHIKNFFLFLNEKENRDIPISIKYTHLPEMVTKHEWNRLYYGVSEEDENLRTSYFNNLMNSDFDLVLPFNKFTPEVTLTVYADMMIGGSAGYFINKNGEPDVTGLDVNEIKDDDEMNEKFAIAAYFNTIVGNLLYDDAFILPNDTFPNHAVAHVVDNYYIIINVKTGRSDITSLDIEKVIESGFGAQYFNTKYDEGRFNEIEGYYDESKKTLWGTTTSGDQVLVDLNGEIIKYLDE